MRSANTRLRTALFVSAVFTLMGCAERSQEAAERISRVSLAIVGQALIEHDPREYLEAPLQSARPILDRADAVFTNLEVAIAGQGCLCQPTRDDVYFHGAEPAVPRLSPEARRVVLALANNHSWDYGTEGILSTIAEADARGLVHSGTGADVSEAAAPAYLDLHGVTLSLISMASVNAPAEARATESRAGVNMLDPDDAADWERNLASVRARGDCSETSGQAGRTARYPRKGLRRMAKIARTMGLLALGTAALGGYAVVRAKGPEAVAQERVRTHTLDSETLGEQREVRVAVPPGYESSAIAYPVVYVLDGRSNLDHTVHAVDYLAGHARIPEMIVVAVHNVSRELDMTPPWMTDLPILMGRKPRGDRFLGFFENELIPFMEREYRTQPLRILVGHSHGGLFANYAFAARPHVFRWHLSLDAPMHLDDNSLAERVTAQVASVSALEARMVSAEEQFGWTEPSWEALVEAAPAGLKLARIDGLEESHESMAFLGTYMGLKELFFDYPRSSNQAMTLDALERQYGELSSAYGHTLSIPQRELLRNARALLTSRRGSQAEELLDRAVEMYGPSRTVSRLQEEADEVIRAGEVTSNEVVEALLSSPPLSPAAITPFLGVWLGRAVHEGGTPMDLEVTFEPESGQVVGSTSVSIRGNRMGDGATPHAFVRVLESGRVLEWGHLNPRGGGGMVVYSVTIEDNDELRGVQEIRGFELELPEGFVMPVTHVTLRRKPS